MTTERTDHELIEVDKDGDDEMRGGGKRRRRGDVEFETRRMVNCELIEVDDGSWR